MDHQQQARNLRSRRRRLSPNLLDSEIDQLDASWTISEDISSSNRFRMFRHLDDPSIPPLLPQTEPPRTDNVFLTTILPLVGFFLVCLLCGRRSVPGEEFHRGHLIRENAQRIWAMEHRKKKRKEATPQERLAKIHSGVQTMKVVAKDSNTGRYQLGEVNAKSEEYNYVHNTTIDSKQSTDTADTMPLECDCESSDDEARPSSNSSIHEDDDEDVCHVCLDGFEIGDTVMFSRNLSCSHVFHEECLLPWLLERRENECPSCRVPLVKEDVDEDDETDNETNLTDENCCDTCQLPSKGNENNVLDIESGDPKSEDQTTYFIDKGRIIAKSNHLSIQNGANCGHEGENSFYGCNESCCPPKSKSLSDNRCSRRPRALSVASMADTQRNTQSALSVPLPLQRVSISLPVDNSSNNRKRNHSSIYDPFDEIPQRNEGNLSTTNTPDIESRETIWLDHRNRFPGLHTSVYYSSSSSSEDSDEDDIIRGMGNGHVANAEQFSSILR